MRVALIHELLTQDGGAEKVLKFLQEIFPTAPTYTMIYDKEKIDPIFTQKKIVTSFIQRLPGSVKHYQWYLPLMPTAIESYDLSSYDIVISSTSGLCKGVIVQPETLHLCYCQSPTRYLWMDSLSYVNELPYPKIVKKIIPFTLTNLRQWDYLAAQRVDVILANSLTVKRRIKKYYHRDSSVVYPPVETYLFNQGEEEKVDNFFLAGGRLVPYKRIDIIVEAFNRLGLPLKIFGSGPDLNRLRQLAKGNIEFLGKIDEATKIKLYQKCIAYINPQVEDFGITAVEAMAAGRPVVAYQAGGALETVIENVTGKFFDEQTWEALADTIIRTKFENFNSAEIKQRAEKFSVDRFKSEIRKIVNREFDRFKSSA